MNKNSSGKYETMIKFATLKNVSMISIREENSTAYST